jgi:hypothetical protein
MITALNQKTTEETTLYKHTLFFLLLLLCTPVLAQQTELCAKLPEARFQLNKINEASYLYIESLHFPENSTDNSDPLAVSYYVVIESENGDYNNQWGPFTGPTPKVFSEDFGPLDSMAENFQFSIQANDENVEADCPNKKYFVNPTDEIASRGNNKSKGLYDDQLENWEDVFQEIDNYQFDKAIEAVRAKRNFTAEDAALYEFATFEIDRGQKDQFEVYFKVYPNPAESDVYIQNIETNERELTLVIMDINGGVKMKKQFEVAKYNRVRMNVNRLKAGNYICAILNKNKRVIGMKHLYKL